MNSYGQLHPTLNVEIVAGAFPFGIPSLSVKAGLGPFLGPYGHKGDSSWHLDNLGECGKSNLFFESDVTHVGG